MPSSQEPIFTPHFFLLCFINVAFFLALNMLLPVMPFYLLDVLKAGKSATGVVLSLYVIASLTIRPLAGYIVDSCPRKTVFLVCAACYALTFSGYLWLDTLVLLGLLRFVHGMTLGLVNTSTTTLLVDMIPPRRMGTGVGFFGLTGAVTMALGPMLGLWLYHDFSSSAVFYVALGIALAGAVAGLAVPASDEPGGPGEPTAPPEPAGPDEPAEPAPKAPILPEIHRSFRERIFLKNAGLVGLGLISDAFSVGLMVNFVAVFARERGIDVSVGTFFALLAAGMIISRFFAGRIIDGGGLCKIILAGKGFLLVSLLALVTISNDACFFLSALVFGLGMGVLFPAYQTMFLNLAPADQRGTANSSLFIAWDGGVGLALFLGGVIAEWTSFSTLFLVGDALVGLAAIFFIFVVRPHYEAFSSRGRRQDS